MKKLYSNPVMSYISMEEELHCGIFDSGEVNVENLGKVSFNDLI